MRKNEIITYLSEIRDLSKSEGLEVDVHALNMGINAIVALDTIKKDLIQIETPNKADSYIDNCLLVINKVFSECE